MVRLNKERPMALEDLIKRVTGKDKIRIPDIDVKGLFSEDRSTSPSDEEQPTAETSGGGGKVADSGHVEDEKATSEQRRVDLQKLERNVQGLGREDRKALALAAVSNLPAEDQRDVRDKLIPTQRVTDWIWQVIVGVFALAFILAVLTLCATVLWQTGGEIQTLLTVITTVAGILAGFISGRASTGGPPS
jgi:hypothetical protein